MDNTHGQEVVGVVVARFQVAELHDGHMALLRYVVRRHNNVLVVLGTRGNIRTKRDPLLYEERELMVRQTLDIGQTLGREGFHADIAPLHDHPFSHERWSLALDTLIVQHFPGCDAILYGSRGSFISLYSGKFSTREIPPASPISGSELRAATLPPFTVEGRAGIIYAVEHRYPIMHAVCDLAIIDPPNDRVLLIGKKHHDGLLTFAGGFAEKRDGNGEKTAIREGSEEVLGIAFSEPVYVGTLVIDDPRFRGIEDGLMGTFYYARYLGGEPRAGDDADYVRWVHPDDMEKTLAPWHRPLAALLKTSWPKE